MNTKLLFIYFPIKYNQGEEFKFFTLVVIIIFRLFSFFISEN